MQEAKISAGIAGNIKSPKTITYLKAWLFLLITLTFIMVTIGGATRLTGSGLSITEWRPVTGAIPPLNLADWLSEFEKYKGSSQYALQNSGMSLEDFKFIYWWEWGHRQLGRLIGLITLMGFLGFTFTRQVKGAWALKLFGLGLLLALQGTIGWIMVASGLEKGMVAVAPIKLTLHLIFACFYLTALITLAVQLGAFGGGSVAPTRGMALAARLLLLGVFVQIALGGMVAGLKAGLIYNTWPLLDGALLPKATLLFSETPLWKNFAENHALVQFNHRLGAYLLLVGSLVVFFAVRKYQGFSLFQKRTKLLVIMLSLQMLLGIITLLLAVPLWAGLAHQAMGLVVLFKAVLLNMQATNAA